MTSTFLSSNCKHDFCYTMANISSSHVQQHTLLSPLSHNFKSFTYFFPYYETCSISVNSLFHAAIKNLHVKANGIFVFLLLHPPLLTTTLSDGLTHTCKNTFLRLKTITNILTHKKWEPNGYSHSVGMDLWVVAMKKRQYSSELQTWSFTTRYRLISYPGHINILTSQIT